MTRHFTSISVGFCVSLLLPAVSTANIVYSDFGPGQSYDITVGNFVGNDFVGDNLAEGDTFTPTATTTFGSLDIALSCVTSCPDSFTVALAQDSGSDSPGTVIESFTGAGASLGALNVNNSPLVFNSVLMPTLTLGTQYWVTVASDLNNTIAWNLNSTGDTSDQAISSDGGATWFSPSGLTPGAYEVNSPSTATPEPRLIYLLGSALAMMVVLRRTHSRRPSTK
jgi:hypothetical protein